MSAVRTDTPAPGIARLTMNKPERRNALDTEMREGLLAAVDAALTDESVRALIVTGGETVFCAGGDISAMGTYDEVSGRARMRANHVLARRLAASEKPVVAGVQGYAMGAGAGLALLADTVVAGEGAQIGFPFFRLGLVPDFGLLHTLPLRAGAGPARQILLHARTLTAAEAQAAGLFDVVVPNADVEARSLAAARALAAQPPHAFALAKQLLRAGPQSFDQALDSELLAQTLCFVSGDHREGVAAFRAKRAPDFR